ncbi:phytanoyl-CoA dioxygenase family protein [Kitasatospora cathayae]|uniref:Phytanoyl-CoA dioxygenase family protein n=1 Tax=Kitasatospora cathayae TaxID=3004092 RepID=A0ABY7QC82_9ACTN|nr:phytanoyl-CoA dioxygenase family protein [Kitasatospora sp. HUAS 3-15]WBP90079.1 phytanoyl-CoA dioxygenase family protein [Kitasatospora sp. HUAS 3-15]
MDVNGFVTDGYLVVRQAFDTATAAACRADLWAALAERGVLREDPGTWTAPLVQLPCPDTEPFAVAAASPKLATAHDRLIGAGRWTRRPTVGGEVPVRFPSEDWPGTGYHIEGNWWGGEDHWTNLRSRGRGLTAFFLFSDVGPEDAPTRLLVGSHRFVPPVLARAGEAGMSGCAAVEALQPSVLHRQAVHVTGRAGDVYLCHPFMVHTATWPHRGVAPRMMAQPGVEVPDGFAVDGWDPSPVARAIVEGLGRPH